MNMSERFYSFSPAIPHSSSVFNNRWMEQLWCTDSLLAEKRDIAYSTTLHWLRPDQINCLFHGSGGSIFLAFEKKNINWIGVVLPATRQWHPRIATVVPCEHCMEVALVSQ